jgi:hypothetical protein
VKHFVGCGVSRLWTRAPSFSVTLNAGTDGTGSGADGVLPIDESDCRSIA